MRRVVRPAGKKAYHHVDLDNALIEAAVKIIGQTGVEALSIREVGKQAGVSRNALYRHFDSKAALLVQVAVRGFRRLHQALTEAAHEAQIEGSNPLEAMAAAYVRFALSNASHYQVMFGPVLPDRDDYPDLLAAGGSAFGALVEGIAHQQRAGRVVAGDTLRFAEIIWAEVHGVATLGINGQLRHKNVREDELGELARFALRCLQTGIARPEHAPGRRSSEQAGPDPA